MKCVQALEQSNKQLSKQSPTVFRFEPTDITENKTKTQVTLSDKAIQTDYTGVQDKECQTDIAEKSSHTSETTNQAYLTQDSSVSSQEGPSLDMEYKEVSHSVAVECICIMFNVNSPYGFIYV